MGSAPQARERGAIGPSSRLVLLLAKFRSSHTVQTLEAAGDVWEYLASGCGESTLILLPGANGTAETMFEIVSALESGMRVVSLGYPATATTAQQLISGLRMILDTLGIQRAFLLGQSLGGMAVQAFASRYPESVQGLVLANTGFYRGVRSWAIPALARLMARAPASFSAGFTKAQMSRLTARADAREFWFEYFAEMMGDPHQAECRRRQAACLSDLARFFQLHPIGPNLGWVKSMPVLIITAEGDRGFTPAEREYLRAVYPKAQLHAFPKGAGHASFIVRPQEFSEAVRRFIEGVGELTAADGA